MNSASWKCKHCQHIIEGVTTASEKANHSRWCTLNPKRKEYAACMQHARNSITIRHNQFSKAKDLGMQVPESKTKGKPGKSTPHTEESKAKLRSKALASPHRRLKKSMQEYRGVKFDSSWEVMMAKRLDVLGISWFRPAPLTYILDGVEHHYFPDFYLSDRDLYLDPKNPHAYNVQRKKIEVLLSTYSNIQFLTSIHEIENFI